LPRLLGGVLLGQACNVKLFHRSKDFPAIIYKEPLNQRLTQDDN
jgi:hypothetical protein